MARQTEQSRKQQRTRWQQRPQPQHNKDQCQAVEAKRYGRPEADSRRLWEGEQHRLAALRVDEDDFDGWSVSADGQIQGLTRIAGVDLSFFPDARHAVACVVVLSFPELEVIDERVGTAEVTTPYVPGYLAFREVPPLAEMLRKLAGSDNAPQALFVDGNGAYHPRGCGCATHLGIVAGLPTVGIAKDVMKVGSLGIKKAEKLMQHLQPGESVNFAEDGKPPLAVLFRPDKGRKTLVVSQGNRVSLRTAEVLARAVCRHSIAEPIRQADLRSRRAVQDWLKGVQLPAAMPQLADQKRKRRRGRDAADAADSDDDNELAQDHGGDGQAAWVMGQLLKKHAGSPDVSGKDGKRQQLWLPKAPVVSAADVAGANEAKAGSSDESTTATVAEAPAPDITDTAVAKEQDDEVALRSLGRTCCSLWPGGVLLAGVVVLGMLRWRARPL